MLKPTNDFPSQLTLAVGGNKMGGAATPTGHQEGGGAAQGPKLRYAQIFTSPWCCSAEKEEEYQALMEEISNLDMDEVTSVLIIVMAMLSPVDPKATQLRQPEAVAARRQHFSQLLFRYLNDRLGPETRDSMFQKYTRLLAKMREMAQILKTERLLL